MTLPSEKPCPIFNNLRSCSECPQTERQWDVERLLSDLAAQKKDRRELTSTERCWLLLLLRGVDSYQIAERFHYNKNFRSVLSRSIYKYVASLTEKKIKHWAQIPLYLELSGYRKQVANPSTETIEIHIKIPANLDKESLNKSLDALQQGCQVGCLRIYITYEE